MQRQRIRLMILALFVILFTCFDNYISAQERTTENITESSPLTFEVSALKSAICLGATSILLTAEITNVSREPVTIDKNFLWNGSISASFNNKKLADAWVSGRTTQIPYTGNFLQLEPEQKYRESFEFALRKDRMLNVFFRRVGRYVLTVDYQAVDLDDGSQEVRKWLYTKPVTSSLKIKVVKCR